MNRKPNKPAKWPRNEPKPKVFDPSRRIYPCKKCRTTLLSTGAQAVIVEKRGKGFVVMFCKECGYHFHMDRAQYEFPKESPCDECGTNTQTKSTQENVQYRKCPKCGANKKEIGTIIKYNKK